MNLRNRILSALRVRKIHSSENSILKNSVSIKAKHEKESARGLKRMGLAKRNMLSESKMAKSGALTKSISRQPESGVRSGKLQSMCEACVPIANREMLLRLRFGVDEEWYQTKFRAQGEVCAICGVHAIAKTNGFDVRRSRSLERVKFAVFSAPNATHLLNGLRRLKIGLLLQLAISLNTNERFECEA